MENKETQPVIPTEQEDASIFSEDDFSVGIYDKHIRQARNAIFVTAGLIFLNVIIQLT